LWHEVALASDVTVHNAVVAKAQARAKDALTELRALVAGFDQQPASMAGLAAEIQRRAGNVCAAAGIAFEFKIGKVGHITLRDSYHSAMFAIEAVENAVLHAKPRSVSVSLSAAPLEVVVEDDGSGFDLATAPQGRGWRNFEKLAAALGGPLEVETSPGKGTRVRIVVEAVAR
jgi:signal transduction histidine kinase